MKRYLTSIVLLGIVLSMLAFWVSGCGAQPTPAPSHGGPVTGYVSLVDNLRAAGVTVKPAGDVSQPFFSVKGQIMTVNGEEVQVFEYADTATADAEAALVSPDGSSVGTTIVTWVATPHFYKTGKLILLYVGDNADVVKILESTLGPRFAGGQSTEEIHDWLHHPLKPVTALSGKE